MKPWHTLIASLLLVLFAAQAALGSSANSAAFDEEYHLAAGYAYLRTGDPRLATEHPPLVNLWNALPLTFLNPKLALDSPAWQNATPDDFGDAFLWQDNFDKAVRIVLLGRLPIIVLGVLLGAVVFRWTREMFGVNAALLALALYAFDPNLIANARLSTTDLGLAVAMTVAMWRLWAWLNKPTYWNLIWVGVAAGAAMTAKFTGLMLAPMFVLVALVYPPLQGEAKKVVWLRRLLALLGAGVVALLVIWAVYGFEIRNGLPAATYWRGLVKIYTEYSQGYPTFLFGQVSRTGWWYYFPVTFALKSPLPTLILFIAGVVLGFAQRTWRRASPALIPPALAMTAAMFSPLAIGYRHILPVLPFVIVLAGNSINLPIRSASSFGIGNRSSRITFYVLLAWLVIGTVLIFPHHLSYFNELAGGPGNADKILVDSNLDWGQDLPALKTWTDKNNIDHVNLAYFGTALPEAYGVRYSPLPSFLRFVSGAEIDSYNPNSPDPGWYAISATSLRLGLMYRMPEMYAHFHNMKPVARAGYSIFIYNVSYPPNMPVDRAVVIGKPIPYVRAETLGYKPDRRLIAKWAEGPDTFIFAMNGPARYIAPDPLPFDRPLRKAFLAAAHQAPEPQEGPDVALIADVRPLVESRRSEWQATLPFSRPVNFGGKLALIGYRAGSSKVARGDVLDLTTYWQVTGELSPPIAFFAHILDDEQHIAGQYDGWGTAIRGLEVGDVIAQHVRVPVRPDASPGAYRLHIGVYSPDTLMRWPLEPAIGANADSLSLAPITVR